MTPTSKKNPFWFLKFYTLSAKLKTKITNYIERIIIHIILPEKFLNICPRVQKMIETMISKKWANKKIIKNNFLNFSSKI